VPKLSRVAGFAGALLVAASATGGVFASSHREAPLTASDPSIDSSDLYAFVSPDAPSTVTMIANYIPMEDPAGGPNFWRFDTSARYEINIDNNHDGVPDVTYRFTFRTHIRNENTFLYNTGQVSGPNDADQNVRQTYTLTRIKHGVATIIGSNIPTAPAFVGPRSDPSGPPIGSALRSLPGGIKVFVGQRDDPFFVDLGSIFDLGGLRPFNNFHLIPGAAAPGIDDLEGMNVQSIAIQVPIGALTRDGKVHTAGSALATVGVWTSAWRRTTTVFTRGVLSHSGPWVQVSRLGNPLINEVLIPVGEKDRWNASKPKNDSNFEKYYLKPELAGLINFLYPALPDAQTTGRTDLSLILLQGLPGLNFTGGVKADELRLNTGIAPCTADSATDDVGQCRRLGAFYNDAADLQAWPNGRRLGDDVVDMELRAIADGYGAQLHALYGVPDLSPNDVIGDGVDANDHAFLSSFPYVAPPNEGYSHVEHGPGMLPL
jgi:Domain of unknown function (DUF4331)